MPELDKASLRKLSRQRLGQLSFPEKESASRKAGDIFLASPLWACSTSILLFSSMDKEPETLRLAEAAFASGKRLAYPRTLHSHGEMELRLVTHSSQLIPGRWNIPEPLPQECPICHPSEIDLAIIPGLAFDRHGYRVGHGGGYYDRLLGTPSFRAVKVGFFFSFQETLKIPTAPHDQNLDWILTELELFKVS